MVFPTPLTPTTIITCGFLSDIINWFSSPEESITPIISSLRIISNSFDPMYLSLETLDSILSIIFKVVFTPTSEEISISSNSSNTSSSTLLLPTITLEILLKKDELVFSKPLSRDCFFCLEKKLEKIDFLFFLSIFLFSDGLFKTTSFL